MSAPKGNQNARKGRIWTEAVKRATARKFNGDLNHGLDQLAERLIEAVLRGDLSAIKEYGDRVEGKCVQPISGSDDDPPVQISHVVREIVRAGDKDTDR